jgi:hypothetical protein
MNRRSFLRNSALALFGFTVLPPAETYQRVWRVTREVMPWDEGPYRFIMSRPVALIVENPDKMLMIENFSISDVIDKVYEYRKKHPQPEVLYA